MAKTKKITQSSKLQDNIPEAPEEDGEIVEMTPEQLKLEVQQQIVLQYHDLMRQYEETYGVRWALELQIQVLGSMIATLVYTAMTSKNIGVVDKAHQNELNKVKFKEMKQAISAAVCSGFEGAERTVTGDIDIEYTCLIQQVNKVINTLMN